MHLHGLAILILDITWFWQIRNVKQSYEYIDIGYYYYTCTLDPMKLHCFDYFVIRLFASNCVTAIHVRFMADMWTYGCPTYQGYIRVYVLCW